MATIYPSLISSDIMNLRRVIELLDPHCDGYHLDVMDNHFVPNLTWGTQFINAIARETSKPLLVHLMVDDPTNWIKKLSLNPHSTISMHIESKGQVRRNIEQIRERNIHPNLAVNPNTEIQAIFPYLDAIDSVLIMSVKPGFSGQSFIKGTEEKLKPLIATRQTQGLNFSIGMDGGINKENIKDLANQGVELFGIASAIFDQPNYVKALNDLQKTIV